MNHVKRLISCLQNLLFKFRYFNKRIRAPVARDWQITAQTA